MDLLIVTLVFMYSLTAADDCSPSSEKNYVTNRSHLDVLGGGSECTYVVYNNSLDTDEVFPQLSINRSLIIECTVDSLLHCGKLVPCFDISGDVNVSLHIISCRFVGSIIAAQSGEVHSLTLVGVKATGNNINGIMVINTSAVVNIHNSTFEGVTRAYRYGGCVWMNRVKRVSITNTVFLNCSSLDSGGALAIVEAEKADIEGSHFESCNSRTSGGALLILASNNTQISSSAFISNVGSGSSGCVDVFSSVLKIINSKFINCTLVPMNKSGLSRGGIMQSKISRVTIDGVSVRGGYAPDGGCWFFEASVVIVRNSDMEDCVAQSGGEASGCGAAFLLLDLYGYWKVGPFVPFVTIDNVVIRRSFAIYGVIFADAVNVSLNNVQMVGGGAKQHGSFFMVNNLGNASVTNLMIDCTGSGDVSCLAGFANNETQKMVFRNTSLQIASQGECKLEGEFNIPPNTSYTEKRFCAATPSPPPKSTITQPRGKLISKEATTTNQVTHGVSVTATVLAVISSEGVAIEPTVSAVNRLADCDVAQLAGNDEDHWTSDIAPVPAITRYCQIIVGDMIVIMSVMTIHFVAEKMFKDRVSSSFPFPRGSAVVHIFFLDGIVSSVVFLLLGETDTSTESALGTLLGVAYLLTTVTAWYLIVFSWGPCARFDIHCQLWVDTNPDTSFCKRYGVFFDSYVPERRWYFAAEHLPIVILSAISASSHKNCPVANGAAIAVFVISLGLLLWLRPFVDRIRLWIAVASALICLLAVIFGMDVGFDSQHMISRVCMLLLSLVTMLRGCRKIAVMSGACGNDVEQGGKDEVRKVHDDEGEENDPETSAVELTMVPGATFSGAPSSLQDPLL